LQLLTILVDVNADPALDEATRGCLDAQGVELIDLVDGVPLTSPRIDTVVTGSYPSASLTSELVGRLGNSVQIVVLVAGGTPAQTRYLFTHKQVKGVIDVDSGTAGVLAQGIIASSCGLECVPYGHGFAMSTRLEEPPEVANTDQIQFLQELASQSVDAAGKKVGYSRGQAQRKYQQLLSELGLENHLELAGSVAKWGLIPRGRQSPYFLVDPHES